MEKINLDNSELAHPALTYNGSCQRSLLKYQLFHAFVFTAMYGTQLYQSYTSTVEHILLVIKIILKCKVIEIYIFKVTFLHHFSLHDIRAFMIKWPGVQFLMLPIFIIIKLNFTTRCSGHVRYHASSLKDSCMRGVYQII